MPGNNCHVKDYKLAQRELLGSKEALFAKRGNRKINYIGKAEYFGVYSPDLGKLYLIPVANAPKGSITLRFKSVGYQRGNRHGTQYEPYSDKVAHLAYWAEDYEI